MSFLRLKIATKLPIIMVGLAVLAIVATGLIAAMESEGALEHSAKEEMRAVAAGRHHELHTYLRSMKNEAKILSDNETVIDALTAFEKGWAAIAGDPTKSLQKTYIQDNPHPKGQKDKLVDPGTGSEYARAHKKYHKWFRELQETRGYYDVFLVNHKGQVVYSVFKEKDFATNVETGRYADSGLGRVTQRLEKNFTDGNIVFEDFAPYAPSGGKPAGFIAAPIFDKANEKHGFLVFQMPIDRITAATEQEVGMGDTGEAFLVGQDHLMRTDSRFDEESSVLRVEVRSEAVTRALNGEKGVFVGPNYEGDRAIIAYRPQEFLGTTWALLAQKNMAEVDEPVAALERDILIAGIIIAVVIAAIGIAFAMSITRPMAHMTAAMRRLADKDWETEVPARNRSDELGAMAGAVQVFKDNGMEMERLQREQEEKDRQAAEERRRLMNQMADDFQNSVGGVVETVSSAATELQSTAQSMSSISEEVNSQATTVASAAEEASTNVSTVASSAEELSSSIQEISRQVQQSTEIANKAASQAEETNQQVEGLASSAEKIGEVVNLIKDIADQTNLLALNATIEAARAGEAGKGFAVVANEVKNLANQTTKATDDISSQIQGVQNETRSAVNAIKEIGGVINQVQEITSSIASAVEEQNAATSEIARNVDQASTGTQEVSSNIQNVTEAAQEAGQASGQVLEASNQLSENAETLKAEMDKFLEKVREG